MPVFCLFWATANVMKLMLVGFTPGILNNETHLRLLKQ